MSVAGLVLTGGGARAAYQAGALRAISRITASARLPFSVITGASAGAINGAALASGAENFTYTAERLWNIWLSLRMEKVFRVDTRSFFRIGFHLARDILLGGMMRHPSSNHLLNSAPLREMLRKELNFGRIGDNIKSGRIRGLAITSTNYSSGTSITFFDGGEGTEGWIRSNRLAKRTRITLDHVMASCAIPLFFPPVRLEGSHFGDGCIRMVSPLSPAIHLGANRIVAIGIRHLRSAEQVMEMNERKMEKVYLANIFGVLLNSIFMDSLAADIERMERINRTISHISESERKTHPDRLRYIPALILSPSRDLGEMASEEFPRFPGILRHLLEGIGATQQTGGELVSYIAFDRSYTSRLLELGYRDTMDRKEEVSAFFSEYLRPV